MEATSHHGLKGGKKKRMRAGKGGSTRNKFLFWFYLDLHPFTMRFPTKLGNRRDKAAPGVREAGRGIRARVKKRYHQRKKKMGVKREKTQNDGEFTRSPVALETPPETIRGNRRGTTLAISPPRFFLLRSGAPLPPPQPGHDLPFPGIFFSFTVSPTPP